MQYEEGKDAVCLFGLGRFGLGRRMDVLEFLGMHRQLPDRFELEAEHVAGWRHRFVHRSDPASFPQKGKRKQHYCRMKLPFTKGFAAGLLILITVSFTSCQAQKEPQPAPGAAAVATAQPQAAAVEVIEPTAAEQLIAKEAGLQILDVRTPEEVSAGVIANAKTINWFDADFATRAEASLDKTKPVLVYCKVGGRSAQAAEVLVQKGFTKVYNLKGGMMKWEGDSHPVQK